MEQDDILRQMPLPNKISVGGVTDFLTTKLSDRRETLQKNTVDQVSLIFMNSITQPIFS